MTDAQFKQDNLDLIKSVGAWPTPTLLMLKRYSDENAKWEWGQLRYVELMDTYEWFYFGYGRYVTTIVENPHVPISWRQIEDMIDSGWMVDA